MDNIRYLNGEQVRLLRTFILAGINYSEVLPNGAEDSFVVVTTELKDNVQEKKAKKSKITKVLIHDNAFDVESHRKQEIDYLDAMHIPSFTAYEEPSIATTVVEEQPDISVVVFATNIKTDEEISLGEIYELVTSQTVINLALDPEAIQRCLDGEQKTHKGFTFDIK